MTYAVVFWLVSGICAWEAVEAGGSAWILAWPALSFGIAGAAYAGAGPRVFGKKSNGTLSLINVLLLLPYLLYTWLLWHIWRLSCRDSAFNELCDGITIGRRLLPAELPAHVRAVFDLTCEFPEPRRIRGSVAYRCVPALDSRAPDVGNLRAAALEILDLKHGVYIHCANGRGRTGTLAAAVLMLSGKAATPDAALALVRTRRRSVSLKPIQLSSLGELAKILAATGEVRRPQ